MQIVQYDMYQRGHLFKEIFIALRCPGGHVYTATFAHYHRRKPRHMYKEILNSTNVSRWSLVQWKFLKYQKYLRGDVYNEILYRTTLEKYDTGTIGSGTVPHVSEQTCVESRLAQCEWCQCRHVHHETWFYGSGINVDTCKTKRVTRWHVLTRTPENSELVLYERPQNATRVQCILYCITRVKVRLLYKPFWTLWSMTGVKLWHVYNQFCTVYNVSKNIWICTLWNLSKFTH